MEAVKKNEKGKGATRAPKTEEAKRKDFLRLAPVRVTRALRGLQSVRGLAKPGRYAWTADAQTKILTALSNELQAVEAAFRNPGAVKAEGFTL